MVIARGAEDKWKPAEGRVAITIISNDTAALQDHDVPAKGALYSANR